MKKAAAYIRVSTSEQTEYSPESQLRMIKDYARKKGFEIENDHIYRDEGISGRNAEKRPEFQKMISAAKLSPPPFDTILIYSTSRFARNHEESIIYRSFLEKECGIGVVSITQPNIDKKTDMLTTAIYSIMDEWYSLDLSDNVKRGMTQKALVGGHQAAPPFGYEIPYKGAPMTVNEKEAEIIRYIFQSFIEGRSCFAIAKSLNDKNITTKKNNPFDSRKISYMLKNPVYSGYSRWTPENKDSIITKAGHLPIIHEEEFQKANELLQLKNNQKKYSKPAETTAHWLSGILKCAGCGSSLVYQKASPSRKNPAFKCGGYCKGFCNTPNFITVKTAENLVISVIKNTFSHIEGGFYLEQSNSLENELLPYAKSTSTAKEKDILARAKKAYLSGLFSLEEYGEIIEKNKMKSSFSNKNSSKNSNKPLFFSNLSDLLLHPEVSKDTKQKLIKNLLEKIVFDKTKGSFVVCFCKQN